MDAKGGKGQVLLSEGGKELFLYEVRGRAPGAATALAEVMDAPVARQWRGVFL